jgi:hypothetical protein
VHVIRQSLVEMPKRQRTAAVQDALASERFASLPPGFGVRLSSAAFTRALLLKR